MRRYGVDSRRALETSGGHMAVKKTATKKPRASKAAVAQKLPQEIQNEVEWMAKNGLSAAIMGDGWGAPGSQNPNTTTQLSQVSTLFKNNRWYLISNMRQLLSEIYIEHGLIQTIVDVPVDDGLRGGVEIQSKQLSEEQIQELQTSLDRDDDLNTVGQALKWNRLYGGAGVLIMTDQDPFQPLDIQAIKKDSPLEFRAVDMWELFWDKQNTEGYDPEIQMQNFEHYNYYAKRLHKSRVMRMKGLTPPSFIRPRLRGWGFSVVEALVRSVNQYLKANDLGFEVLDEFKLDVFKIKNLTNTLLSPAGDQKIRQRVALANAQKNFQNAIVMDSEDDFDHKQLSFSGLAETMLGIRMQVASDMRMPMTKLFGISAAGFSSGEDDIENYNAMVESQVRNKAKYDILRMIEIKCQKLFGFIPDDLSIEFKPLRILGAEQEENVKTQKFNRALAARQAGELTREEFRDICNRGNLLDIQLDKTDALLLDIQETQTQAIQEGDEAKEEPGQDDPEKSEDSDDPGANREDTRKPQLKKEGGGVSTIPSDKQSKLKAPEAPQVKNAVEWAKRKLPEMQKQLSNSLAFEVKAFETDFTRHIDIRRKEFFHPQDKDLWKRLQEQAAQAYPDAGKAWQFAMWLYQKQGGKL